MPTIFPIRLNCKSRFYKFCINILLCCAALTACQTVQPGKTSLPATQLNTQLKLYKFSISRELKVTIDYHKPAWKHFAHQAEVIFRNADKKMFALLGVRPSSSLEVRLLEHAAFKALVTRTEWVSAAYYKGNIYIPIKSKRSNLNSFSKTITHENSHAAIDNLCSSKAPAWFDEGLALLVEGPGQRYGSSTYYQEWRRNHPPLDFRLLEKGFTHLNKETSQLAYTQSRLAVTRLLDQGSSAKLMMLCREFADDSPPEQALKDVYGLSYSELAEGLR